jgi:predicted dehydrogenase
MSHHSKPTACVVGAGFVGPAHVEALRRNGIEVRALAADGEEEAARRAAELNIPRAYGSLRAALEDSGADVYHLAVPNALHAPYAREVLAAGRHVVCEKPLALSSAESAELVAAAAAAGKVAAVSYNLRFYPMVREARERIAAGTLGRVHAVHGSYLQDWLLHDTDWNWRLDPARGGKLRAVADIGTHWLDMVAFVSGLRIERVFAEFSIVHPVRRRPKGDVQTFMGKEGSGAEREDVNMATEDQAAIMLGLENGAIGSLLVSQASAGRKNTLSFQIDGGSGSLAWNSENPNRLWLGHRDAPNEVLEKDPSLLSAGARRLSSYPGGHQEGYPDTFRQFFASVYSYIAAGDFSAPRDFPTFEDGHREMVYCDALLESARTGRWVRL